MRLQPRKESHIAVIIAQLRHELVSLVVVLILALSMLASTVFPAGAQALLRTPAGHILLPDQAAPVCSTPAPEASPALACIPDVIVQ
jgi:hypothetical protein